MAVLTKLQNGFQVFKLERIIYKPVGGEENDVVQKHRSNNDRVVGFTRCFRK